jgi:hypothetical protein
MDLNWGGEEALPQRHRENKNESRWFAHSSRYELVLMVAMPMNSPIDFVGTF